MGTTQGGARRGLTVTAIALIAMLGTAFPTRAWGAADRDSAASFNERYDHGSQDYSRDDDDGLFFPGHRHDVCRGLRGFAFGLCVAYCDAQHCNLHPERRSCEVLRRVFRRLTGESTFPCDSGVPTATQTATATAPPTDTATAPPTDTATALPSNSPTGTPTGSAAATVTSTPTATAAAASTDTATALPSSTATGTPTGTAAATVTSTPTATGAAANTSTATATAAASTPTATATSATTSTATIPPTPTDTPTATNIPTPTATTGPTCPLSAGRYTETTTGGSLKVSTFLPFTFPAGGKTIQDVSDGDANCVHSTVVPYPGGFSVPIFCVPALGYTVQVTQTGCGVGEIDSDGGSDFTVTEHGDTSYGLNGCAATQSCSAFVDSSGEIDLTVGDGTADTCSGGGAANAIVSIPVNTLTWLAADASCPDSDGTFDPASDTEITQFPQTLDLTTDSSTALFADNDGDGCSLKGAGPAGPFTSTGTCLDLGAQTVSVAAGGTVFSSAAPLHDLLFTTTQNSTVGAPSAPGGATCDSPPVIDFNGLAHRCIIAP